MGALVLYGACLLRTKNNIKLLGNAASVEITVNYLVYLVISRKSLQFEMRGSKGGTFQSIPNTIQHSTTIGESICHFNN